MLFGELLGIKYVDWRIMRDKNCCIKDYQG